MTDDSVSILCLDRAACVDVWIPTLVFRHLQAINVEHVQCTESSVLQRHSPSMHLSSVCGCLCLHTKECVNASVHARMHTFIVTQYEVNTRTHHCCEMKGSRIQSVGLCSPQTGIKARRRNICCNDHDDNLNSAGVRRRSTKGLSLRSALKSATDFYKTSKKKNQTHRLTCQRKVKIINWLIIFPAHRSHGTDMSKLWGGVQSSYLDRFFLTNIRLTSWWGIYVIPPGKYLLRVF